MDKNCQINLIEINPYIRRSAVNHLAPGFYTGYRRIYHYQLQYIYSGYGEIEIEGVYYKASKGDLFLWGPGESHSIRSSSNDPLTILGVQFDFTRNHENKVSRGEILQYNLFSYANINEIIIFRDFTGFPHYTRIQNPGKTEQLLLETAHEYSSQKIFFLERASSLLRVFLIMVARQIVVSSACSTDSTILVDRIIDYIHANYNKNLTNKDIANYFNFHPNYLNKLLVKNTGMSLHKYILNTRLNKAVELIHNTQMTIGEIATAVGFDNIHYFSLLFKKKLGFPPSQYK